MKNRKTTREQPDSLHATKRHGVHFGDSLLLPAPANIRRDGSVLQFPENPAVYQNARCMFVKTICREINAAQAPDPSSAVIKLLPHADVPKTLKRWSGTPEGYAAVIGKKDIRIWASSDAGFLYGTMTLAQLLRRYGAILPCMTIGDSPALARRGVQLSFPQGHTTYRQSYMRYLVPWLARMKINELYLYLESYFDFPSLPHIAGPDAMTPAHARALDKLCKNYNITVIPMLNTLAHCGELLATQRYNHLGEYKAGSDRRLARPFNLCASSKEVRQIIDTMLEDLCDCFSAPVIHVGGDEISCIGECPECEKTGKDALTLYLEHFSRVLAKLRKHGRSGGLWGDMLLHYFKPGKTGALPEMPENFVENSMIFDWHYSGGSPDTLKFFVNSGFRTIACSSTHLCYSSAVWPAQRNNQRALFKDALEAGAEGGMTTAWVNWLGMHEEQYNYLHASGAALLWSGVENQGVARGLNETQFETAYCLQRYGLERNVFTDYLHTLGDASGPVLSALSPLHGPELRKCLYHTNNVLRFWTNYAEILKNGVFLKYKTGVKKARSLWNKLTKTDAMKNDPYFKFFAGPLLTHEHLIARYEMTEAFYFLYDRAAKAQYNDPAGFKSLLEQAAQRLEQHLNDFTPVETYLRTGRTALGFDRSTLNRMRATRKNIRELSAFIRHLKKSHRPLPVFQQLNNTFFEQSRTDWYGDREHDWAAETQRFLRFTTASERPWACAEARPDQE